jgi:hypothetical protein
MLHHLQRVILGIFVRKENVMDQVSIFEKSPRPAIMLHGVGLESARPTITLHGSRLGHITVHQPKDAMGQGELTMRLGSYMCPLISDVEQFMQEKGFGSKRKKGP